MLTALFMTFSAYAAASTTSYYVSTTGSDSNPGTKSKPFKSLMKAQSAASSGDTVYIRGEFMMILKLRKLIVLIIMYMLLRRAGLPMRLILEKGLFLISKMCRPICA